MTFLLYTQHNGTNIFLVLLKQSIDELKKEHLFLPGLLIKILTTICYQNWKIFSRTYTAWGLVSMKINTWTLASVIIFSKYLTWSEATYMKQIALFPALF